MGTVYATTDDLTSLGLPASALGSISVDAQNAALAAASALADGYLNARFVLPLTSWGTDLRQAVCQIAAWSLLSTRGVNPAREGNADAVYLENRDRAMRWLRDVAGEDVTPIVTDSSTTSTPPAPQVYSLAPRGWDRSDGRL